MAADTPIHLIFHVLGVEPRPYAYYVPIHQFQEYLQATRAQSTQACFTFDDGHDSNRTYALPILADAGVKAKFFLVAGWIGSRLHFMNWARVRELVEHGHEIGSHGWSHALLTQCSDSELRNELARSKETIEQRIGQPVDAISVPSGRWNRRVLQAVRDAGYSRMYTSDPFLSHSDGQFALRGRINATQNISPAELGRILRRDFSVVTSMRAKHAAKVSLRRVLGEAAYHRLWAAAAGYSEDDT